MYGLVFVSIFEGYFCCFYLLTLIHFVICKYLFVFSIISTLSCIYNSWLVELIFLKRKKNKSCRNKLVGGLKKISKACKNKLVGASGENKKRRKIV